MNALELGLERGGLSPEARRKIYDAIQEQIALFYEVDAAMADADAARVEGNGSGETGDASRGLAQRV